MRAKLLKLMLLQFLLIYSISTLDQLEDKPTPAPDEDESQSEMSRDDGEDPSQETPEDSYPPNTGDPQK